LGMMGRLNNLFVSWERLRGEVTVICSREACAIQELLCFVHRPVPHVVGDIERCISWARGGTVGGRNVGKYGVISCHWILAEHKARDNTCKFNTA
jgi:hypothetical protein